MYFEKIIVKMQKKTYKMTSKTEFIGIFCYVDSLMIENSRNVPIRELKIRLSIGIMLQSIIDR